MDMKKNIIDEFNKKHFKSEVRRKLIPQDLGFKNPTYIQEFKEGWNTITHTIDENQYILIEAYGTEANNLTQLEINRNGCAISIQPLEEVDYEKFDAPILLKPEDVLDIKIYSSQKRRERLIFEGKVCELHGIRIMDQKQADKPIKNA